MVGQYVPLVMVPRFTSFVGQGTYTTVPLNVEDYAKATLEIWRGPLVGDPFSTPAAGFTATLETSQDADTWVAASTPITTPDASDKVAVTLIQKWLRIKFVLNRDADYVVAMTCWAAGFLERREET